MIFRLLEGLTKTVLNVAVLPVAAAVDIVTLPATALDNKPAFGTTEKVVGNIADNLKKVLE